MAPAANYSRVQLYAEAGKMYGEKILVAEDEGHLAELIGLKLSNAGYRVLMVTDGEVAVAKAQAARPDLVVLDTTLPLMDGFEVCHEFRRAHGLRDIPIIILLPDGQGPEQVAALGLRVDDYLAKPFSPRELLAKVNKVMARARYLKEANPLLGWPGKRIIYAQAALMLSKGMAFDLLALDLDDFHAFNRAYGYERGNGVIRFLADVIKEAVEDLPGADYWLGHDGGDDFLLLLPDGTGSGLAGEIMRRFEKGIAEHYAPEDRERGGLLTRNRRGLLEQRPFLTLSMALVKSTEHGYSDPLELDGVAYDLMLYAKSMQGSNYVRDRRRA